MTTEQELKGAEVDFKFEGGQVQISVEHVGKVGSVTLVAKADAKPLLEKAVDELEKLIPGDQKAVATMLKLAIANAKF